MRFKTVYLILFITITSNVNASSTGVIYAQSKEPLNSLYRSISQKVIGLSEASGVYQEYIDKSGDDNKLASWIDQRKIRSAVVLGKKAAKKLYKQHNDISFVLGATFINPDKMPNISGVSMAPSPAELFQHLKHIAPHISHVHVIYNPAHQQWLMDRARLAAENLGLNLIMHPAEDISQTALKYKEITLEQVASKEALWLPYSGKSVPKALRQEILEAAWKRKLIVFSSNLSDVNKGILFSLFADHNATGKQLFELMESRKNTLEDNSSVQLSKNLNRAINIRTAKHLGIEISDAERAKYALLYPLSR
ncbi:ABC transporter substrate binding protein [Agarilytica rhodophyticola]|uniref:ABC transporter substrate binding protein n=1 Tax=Agarilytica rhodophyticola TaxID=1737490 RepID=UPI000B346320|nr:ABC transporter substrate binding protein [Agarilytica rhodophyticola]